ncbi:hypothetical protein ACJX0J_017133 [Zea mays]
MEAFQSRSSIFSILFKIIILYILFNLFLFLIFKGQCSKGMNIFFYLHHAYLTLIVQMGHILGGTMVIFCFMSESQTVPYLIDIVRAYLYITISMDKDVKQCFAGHVEGALRGLYRLYPHMIWWLGVLHDFFFVEKRKKYGRFVLL